MGEAAVNAIIDNLNGVTAVKTTNTIILRSELIIRASSTKNKNL
jgi:LacI family transcriptional regulator